MTSTSVTPQDINAWRFSCADIVHRLYSGSNIIAREDSSVSRTQNQFNFQQRTLLRWALPRGMRPAVGTTLPPFQLKSQPTRGCRQASKSLVRVSFDRDPVAPPTPNTQRPTPTSPRRETPPCVSRDCWHFFFAVDPNLAISRQRASTPAPQHCYCCRHFFRAPPAFGSFSITTARSRRPP